jgi:hypothetical protein
VNLEIEGQPLGKHSLIFDPPIREFLCEGTHEAVLTFPSVQSNQVIERHRIKFLVSRPSIFHATQLSKRDDEESSCISGGSVFNVGLELSPLDPNKASSAELAARAK